MSERGNENFSLANTTRGVLALAFMVSKIGIGGWLILDGFSNQADPFPYKVWKTITGTSLVIETAHDFLKKISR